jgi:hypothetical protein
MNIIRFLLLSSIIVMRDLIVHQMWEMCRRCLNVSKFFFMRGLLAFDVML